MANLNHLAIIHLEAVDPFLALENNTKKGIEFPKLFCTKYWRKYLLTSDLWKICSRSLTGFKQKVVKTISWPLWKLEATFGKKAGPGEPEKKGALIE